MPTPERNTMPTKPQDHKTTKAAQDAEAQERFDELEGHELLKPISQVKGSDQTRLLARLQSLGLVGDGDAQVDEMDLEAVADLIDYVAERFAVDSDEFEKFTMGPGGYKRAMSLAVGYAGELGKDVA
jgi:hypothetical protein